MNHLINFSFLIYMQMRKYEKQTRNCANANATRRNNEELSCIVVNLTTGCVFYLLWTNWIVGNRRRWHNKTFLRHSRLIIRNKTRWHHKFKSPRLYGGRPMAVDLSHFTKSWSKDNFLTGSYSLLDIQWASAWFYECAGLTLGLIETYYYWN